MAEEREYIVSCWHCTARFNAFDASFCSHIDPSKICPYCLRCSCDAPEGYKRDFIHRSPRELLEEKVALQGGKDLRLGEILLKSGKVSEAQLKEAMARQVTSKERLGEILVKMGVITLDELTVILVDQKTIEEIDLVDFEIDFELVNKIGKEFCLGHELVPIELFRSKDVTIFRFAVPSKAHLMKIKEAVKDETQLRGSILIPYLAKKEIIEVLLEEIKTYDIFLFS